MSKTILSNQIRRYLDNNPDANMTVVMKMCDEFEYKLRTGELKLPPESRPLHILSV